MNSDTTTVLKTRKSQKKKKKKANKITNACVSRGARECMQQPGQLGVDRNIVECTYVWTLNVAASIIGRNELTSYGRHACTVHTHRPIDLSPRQFMCVKATRKYLPYVCLSVCLNKKWK